MPPKRQSTSDPLDILHGRVLQLEERIKDLQSNKIHTVPTYDASQLPAKSVEGQVAIIKSVTVTPPSIPPQVLEGTSAYMWVNNNVDIPDQTKTFLDLDNGNTSFTTNDRTGSTETISNASWTGNNFEVDLAFPDRIRILTPGIYHIVMAHSRNPTPGAEVDRAFRVQFNLGNVGFPGTKVIEVDSTLEPDTITADFASFSRTFVVRESDVPIVLTPWLWQDPGIDWTASPDDDISKIIYQIIKLRDITGVTGGGGGTLGDAIRYIQDNTGEWVQIDATGSNPTVFAIGGPHGINSNWSFAINGTDIGIGASGGLWLVGLSVFISSGDETTPGLVNSNDHNGTTTFNSGDFTIGASRFVQINAGTGFEIDANGGIFIDDNDGSGLFLTSSGGIIELNGDTSVNLFSDTQIRIGNGGADVPLLLIDVGAGGIVANLTAGGGFSLDSDDDIIFRIPVGKKFIVKDSALGTIFEVDENGDLHGKTGKSLVFDR